MVIGISMAVGAYVASIMGLIPTEVAAIFTVVVTFLQSLKYQS